MRLDGATLPADATAASTRPARADRSAGAFTLEVTSRIDPAANTQPDGPLPQQRRLLHPVRARGLPADRLRRRTGPDVMSDLPGADRGRPGGLPGAAVERQSAGDRRAAGRPALGAVGGPVPQALLPVRAGGRRSRLPRGQLRHPLRPHGPAADLLRAGQHRPVPPRHGVAQEVDDVGRGALWPGVRSRPVPDRRRQRLQFRCHGEQGPQHLQHLGDPGPLRHRDRRRLRQTSSGSSPTNISTTGPATGSPAATGSS